MTPAEAIAGERERTRANGVALPSVPFDDDDAMPDDSFFEVAAEPRSRLRVANESNFQIGDHVEIGVRLERRSL